MAERDRVPAEIASAQAELAEAERKKGEAEEEREKAVRERDVAVQEKCKAVKRKKSAVKKAEAAKAALEQVWTAVCVCFFDLFVFAVSRFSCLVVTSYVVHILALERRLALTLHASVAHSALTHALTARTPRACSLAHARTPAQTLKRNVVSASRS